MHFVICFEVDENDHQKYTLTKKNGEQKCQQNPKKRFSKRLNRIYDSIANSLC